MDESAAKDGRIEMKYVCGRFHSHMFMVDPNRMPLRRSCPICAKAGLRGVMTLPGIPDRRKYRPKCKPF